MASICKRLEKNLGGKWFYRQFSTWECDDGVRVVRRCAAPLDEWENPCGPSQWFLYGDGMPVRAEQFVQDKVYFRGFLK